MYPAAATLLYIPHGNRPLTYFRLYLGSRPSSSHSHVTFLFLTAYSNFSQGTGFRPNFHALTAPWVTPTSSATADWDMVANSDKNRQEISFRLNCTALDLLLSLRIFGPRPSISQSQLISFSSTRYRSLAHGTCRVSKTHCDMVEWVTEKSFSRSCRDVSGKQAKNRRLIPILSIMIFSFFAGKRY